MPRLSLWRENHSNDYKFFDRRISEMFTIGGTGMYIHKYLGTQNQTTAYTTTANSASGTSSLSFAVVLSGSTLVLQATSLSGTWYVTSGVRSNKF